MKHRRDWAGSTSLMPVEWVPRTGFIEGLILLAVTSSPLFALGPAAISAITTALTAVAITAAVMGIAYLTMPKPPKPEGPGGRLPMSEPIPPRIFGIGTNRVAGYHMLWDVAGSRLFAVQAICGHRISEIRQYWLHDDEVDVNDNGNVQGLSDGRYGSGAAGGSPRVWLDHRLGNVPETPYGDVVSALGSTGRWTENHRGDGQASIAMIARSTSAEQFSERFPHGAPQPSAEADFARLYDWRDPSQNINNPDTWKFSKNAALAMVWQECFNPFGPQQDFDRTILPVIDLWTEEADICDELVPRAAGGTERRYEVNGWGTTETDPIAIQNAILASCDGHLVRRGDGALILTVGKFRESRVATLTDDDIVGHVLQTDYPEEESVNRLVPKFTYPATGFTTTVTDYFESTEDQIRDGRILARDADFQWVHQWRQARRLGKREWLRRQEKIHGSLNVRLSGVNAVYSRWIRLETAKRMPTLNGEIIENRRSILSLMQGGYQMDWVKHPANIEDWNPVTDEGAAPPVPPKVYGDGLPSPTLDSLFAIPSNGSVYLRAVIVDPDRDDLTPAVRWRIKDTGGGAPGTWNQQTFPDAVPDSGLIVLTTGSVPNGTVLQVQVAFRGPGGSFSDWAPATPEEVTTTVDTTPPGALTGVSVDGDLGHTGIAFTAPDSENVARVRIYRNTTGTLDRENDLLATLAVAPAQSRNHTDGDGSRVNLLTDPGFDTSLGGVWTQTGTTWTISGSEASKLGGSASALRQSLSLSVGASYRTAVNVISRTAGSINTRLSGGTNVSGPTSSSEGWYVETLQAVSGNNAFDIVGNSAFEGTVDDAVCYEQTSGSLAHDTYYYWLIPENGSGVEGDVSGPHQVTVI